MTNSVTSYYLYRDRHNFRVESFNIDLDISNIVNNLATLLNRLGKLGFSNLIIPLKSINYYRLEKAIVKSRYQFNIIIPSINREDIVLDSDLKSRIIFSGIDYDKMTSNLINISSNKLVVFSENKFLSQNILKYIKQQPTILNKKIQFFTIKDVENLTTYYIKHNKLLDDSTILINMNLISSSIVVSLLNRYNVKYKKILLTQNCYSNRIFNLLQDRDKIFISNIIEDNISNKLIDISRLNNIDIDYNWLLYGTIVSLDYLSTDRKFNNIFLNNQLTYNYYLMSIDGNHFSRMKVN